MRADGLDDRDAGLLEQPGEVANLADVVRDRLLVGCLSDPLRERLHVMAGKTAVVREAFEDDDQLARPACHVVVVGREEAADRHEVVLLRREHRAVCERCDLTEDLLHRPAGLARLALGDEDGVLGGAGRVEVERHVELAGERAHRAQVLERERLAARHVEAGLLAHERDPLAPLAHDQVAQLAEVDVPLERVARLGIARLGNRHVRPHTACELGVNARGGEVQVRQHELPRLHEHPREQMLRPASLVRRDQVPPAVHLAHRRLEPVEAARAGIRLVAELHRRPLLLRHGRCAAVGQQIDVDVVRAEQERVEAGCDDRLATGGGVRQPDRLDDLDLVRRKHHDSDRAAARVPRSSGKPPSCDRGGV